VKVFTYRWDFLRPLVEGKDVLEIGPAELVGTVNKRKRDRWIHGRIADVAERLVGVEVSEPQVGALRAEGFDVRLGDAETFDLGEGFDVIVAGELIEHLSNPGLFLDRARDASYAGILRDPLGLLYIRFRIRSRSACSK
jgi:hypothetical protein